MKKNISIYLPAILLAAAISGCNPAAKETAGAFPKNHPAAEETTLDSSEKKLNGAEYPEELLHTETESSAKPQTLRFVDAWGDWFETTINPNIKKHDYDFSLLERNGDDIRYEGDPRYTLKKGIDVSHHQNAIDWEKVKAAGYDFAFIRIVYRGYGSSGSLNLDREYRSNIIHAKEAGLQTGVYVFSQAINEAEAEEEAQMVIDHLQDITLDLPVVYDPELIRDDTARTDNVTGEQFTKNTIAFCEKIKAAGFQPMIYSNMYWEAFLFDLEQLKEYPIWYADYENIPQTPYAFTFWQYSESGNVDGIEGVTDLNAWFMANGQAE